MSPERISPPAWGWPAHFPARRTPRKDFPTRVGMARVPMRAENAMIRFPHPRGDGPKARNCFPVLARISPPAWGWPAFQMSITNLKSDFPTRVGMARVHAGILAGALGFPHPRGDGPGTQRAYMLARQISPPAWGWPGWNYSAPQQRQDFPTRVGMARFRSKR